MTKYAAKAVITCCRAKAKPALTNPMPVETFVVGVTQTETTPRIRTTVAMTWMPCRA